jgi:hypothetical protein
MALLYEVDFTAQANQTFGAAGSVTIDGKTWWLKGSLTPSGRVHTNAIVNGSGFRFGYTSGAFGDIGTNTTLATRHAFLPLSSLTGWDSSKAYMVRARFSYPGGLTANTSPLVGIVNTTSDAVELQAAHRAGDLMVGPSPNTGATNLLKYKFGGAAATSAGTARSGTIANNVCVVGINHITPRFALVGSENLASGMPTDIVTHLPHNTVVTQDYNGLRSNPGVFIGFDIFAATFDVTHLRIDSIGDLTDTTAPVVTLVSPAQLTRLRRFDRIVFDVNESTFHKIDVIYDRLGIVESAFDSADPPLVTGYSAAREAVAGGYRYTLYRRGGWPSAPRLRVRASDGNFV